MCNRICLGFIAFLLLFSIGLHLAPDRFKDKKHLAFTPIPTLQSLSPAGEVIGSFELKQSIEITPQLLKKISIYNPKSPVTVDLFMANYSNRKNCGKFLVSMENSTKKVKKNIEANSIKDNQWHTVCFSDFPLSELTLGPLLLTIKGINSPKGKAVTVWLQDSKLIYRLSAMVTDNISFQLLKINILLLTLGLILLTLFCHFKGINDDNLYHWFQNKLDAEHIVYVLLAFPLLLQLMSYLPVLQSPDEWAHVTKGYMLATGQLGLTTVDKSSTGGYIDTNLNKYLLMHQFIHSERLSVENSQKIEEAKKLYFSNTKVFTACPGAAIYPPVLYLPQGIVFRISIWLNLSIDLTYSFLRLTTIILNLLIAAFALKLLPMGKELMLIILLLPMTLAQTSAVVIDGYIFSLSLLLWALLAHGLNKSNNWNLKHSVLSWAVLGTLIATRPSFVFYGFLFLFLEVYRKKYRSLLIMALTGVMVLGWCMYAFSNTVDLRIPRPLTTGQLVINAINDPFIFITPFCNTMTIENILEKYYKPFVGVLGFLDVYLPSWLYIIAAFVMFVSLIPVAFDKQCLTHIQRLMISGVIIASSLIIFFLLWASWTPIGSPTIEGVQGRYFIPMVFGIGLICSGIFSKYKIAATTRNVAFKLVLLIWIFVIYTQVPKALISKLWY